MTPHQRLAFANAVEGLTKAHMILLNVKVSGWQPLVLLRQVSEHLAYAAEQLSDAGAGYLSPVALVKLSKLHNVEREFDQDN